MTVGDLEDLLRETDHNGFPVVVSKESHSLVGMVSRRDLHLAISKPACLGRVSLYYRPCFVSANARKTQEGIVTSSVVYFTAAVPAGPEIPGGPAPLKLRKLMDLVSRTRSFGSFGTGWRENISILGL